MGGVKKIFKSVGKLVGLGGSEKVAVPATVATEPTPTVVTDTSADASGVGTAADKKKRRGFASTQLAGSTSVGDSTSSGRSTLG